MSRSRLFLFAGLVGALLVGAALSVVRVPEDALVLSGGRVLPPGAHLGLPWSPRFEIPLRPKTVLPAVPLSGPGGTAMTVGMELRVEVRPQALQVPTGQVAEAGGWEPYLARRAGAALDGALAAHPDADPLTAAFGKIAAAAVEESLRGPGLEVGEVVLLGGDDPAWRAYREARVRAGTRTTGRKVLLIGLDGADWQLIDPLLERGRLPGLASLLRRGVRADLRSNDPMLSPLLWTTVATGKPPEDHGIIDFLLVDTKTGRRVPMSSTFRRTKALWNILTDVGRDSAFVAWWATWPAERVEGTMVTDRVSYSLFAGITPEPGEGGAGLTFPPGYIDQVKDRLVRPADLSYDQARRFLRISREEFERGMARLDRPTGGPPEDPVVALARVVAAARTYHAIGLDLLRRGQPELTAIYYEGIDQVGHRFMHCAPPRMSLATDAEWERYRDTVGAYYEYQDELLRELLAAAGPETVFVLLSDHGFKNGAGRPPGIAPYVSEKPGFWHRRYGVFVLAGPGVRHGTLDPVSLYDIAPTVLAILGLPRPEDMGGRVLDEAFLAPVRPSVVATYEGIGERAQAPVASAAGSAIEAEMVRELTALGYLAPGAAEAVAAPAPDADPGAGEARVTANYHLNLASILASRGKHPEAEVEIRKALAKAPLPEAQRMLSEVREQQGDLAGAIEAQERFLAAGGDDGSADAGRLRLVGLLLEQGDVEAARRTAAGVFGSDAVHRTAQGLVAEREGRIEEAMALYRAALGEQPTLAAAMTRLYPLTPPSRLGELEPVVRRGLERNDQLAAYHNVLGVILKGRGDLAGAVAAYRRALALEPDQAEYLANLGNAEMIRGRLDAALEALERARRMAPDNPDVWVGLASVHGKAGRPAESLAAFQRAVELGAEGPGPLAGIALAYLQLDDAAAARRVLDEARGAYPDDPMLAELSRSLP